MRWPARFGAGLAAVSLVEVLLAEVLPAAAETVDLFLLLVVLSSLSGNSLHGVAGGLAAGLVQDTLTATPFGLHALACCVVGYGAARLSQRVMTNQRLVAWLLVAVGTLLHQAIALGLLAVLDVGEFGGGAAVPARVAATTAAGVPSLWLANRFESWADERRTLNEGRTRLR